MALLDKLSNLSVPRPRVEITISNRTILRLLAWAFGAWFVFTFFNRIGHSLTLIAVSAFLAMALNPAVSWMTHRLPSKSRVRGTAAAYVLLMTLLISFTALIVPPLARQTTEFVKNVPATVEDLKTQNSSIGRTVRRLNLDKELDKLSADLKNKVGDIAAPAFSTAGRVASTVASFIAVLVMTFMMLVEGPIWLNRLWKIHPDGDKEEHRRKLAGRMYKIVTGYVNGQLLLALIAASFATVVLFIMSTFYHASVVNPVALGGIVFLFGLIPLIGNILATAVVVLICLLSSLPLALSMLVYFVVYMQIENATLQPHIQAKHNELTPLLVFVSALVGAGVGGLLGAFVSIPLAGCLKILAEDYLENNRRALTK